MLNEHDYEASYSNDTKLCQGRNIATFTLSAYLDDYFVIKRLDKVEKIDV